MGRTAQPDRPVLLLNGACGVGKTTLAEALSDLLNLRNIAHAVMDIDALSKVFPRPSSDRFGSAIALVNLRTLLPNLGTRPLILARVIETDADLHALRSALAPCRITHVLLRADLATLYGRLQRREAGTNLEWHCNRAAALDASLSFGPSPDLTLDTGDLDPEQAALALLAATDWPAKLEQP
jgi:adenylylsulfate kinase